MSRRYHFIIDKKLYDLTDFIPTHPGGTDMCYLANHDVSNHYKMLHGRSFDHEKMSKYLCSSNTYVPAPGTENNTTKITPFGQEMISRVNALFKNKEQTYADYRYYTKAFTILFLTLIFEILYLKTNSLIVSLLLGTLYALIGLNVGHDANHGALGKAKWYHEIFKFSTDWIGGSKVMWIQQHVLSHHAYTNHVELDNDITSAEPFLVFHPSSKKIRAIHAFQHMFYVFIIKLYAFSSLFNLGTLMRMQHFDKFHTSAHALDARTVTLSFRIFVIFRLFLLPFFFQANLSVVDLLLKVSVTILTEGIILAFLFLISHNFEESTKVEFTNDWHMDQVITSSTYGGKIAGFFTGGLNYQIEHHLFPRISHVHYPKIHETVKEVCAKYGVKYTYYPDAFTNFWSTMLHIRDVGNQRIQEAKKAK